MIDRDEAIKRIRQALKQKTGKSWSVTGGRGTSWGWITVQAPPRRRVSVRSIPGKENEDLYYDRVEEYKAEGENHYTSRAECKELARAFGVDNVHNQGLGIGPDRREAYVAAVEGVEPEEEEAPPAKIKVARVVTGFSEKSGLNNREFASVSEFDAEVARLVASHSVTDLSYYKTDVVVIFEDGTEVPIRADVNRANNLSTEFVAMWRRYVWKWRAHNCPEWITPAEWSQRHLSYKEFFEKYEV
jgi:hypothetical protein